RLHGATAHRVALGGRVRALLRDRGSVGGVQRDAAGAHQARRHPLPRRGDRRHRAPRRVGGAVTAPDAADLDYCYITTTGRRSGKPHTIEIWFALDGRTLYLLAG